MPEADETPAADAGPVDLRLGRPETPAESWEPKNLLRKANALRRKSKVCVTCPGSRHTLLMAQGLISRKGYPMLADEPEHCAASMLATVTNLWQARAELDRLRDALTWALGGHKDGFATREPGQGPFWWRLELADRAGFCWNGEAYERRPNVPGNRLP